MSLARCIGLCAIAINGCSLIPAYERPALPVASIYQTDDASRPVVGGAVPAADIGWRDVFQDPRLQRLVETALANNRDLRVAALNVEQARAFYRIERSASYPRLDASASHASARTQIDGVQIQSRYYSAGLSASWEIDIFGRSRSLSEAALHEFFGTAHGRRAAHILLVSQVANQYLALLADDELLNVTRDTLATARDAHALSKAQFEGGVGNELALRQAEGVLQQAQANYAAQQRQHAQDENVLVLLLGAPLPADLPPTVPLESQSILGEIPAGLPSDLLARRPDVLQAESALRAANASIGAARAAFFPSIRLTGAFGSTSGELRGLFKGGAGEWSFVPSVSLPIFQGGALRASLDAATTERDVRVARYEKAIQAAFTEVANGLAARGSYDDQVSALERYVAAEQVALQLAIARFRAGIDNYLNVLTAQDALYRARQALVLSRLARLANYIALYQALGGGWAERTGEIPRDPEDIALRAPEK